MQTFWGELRWTSSLASVQMVVRQVVSLTLLESVALNCLFQEPRPSHQQLGHSSLADVAGDSAIGLTLKALGVPYLVQA